MGEFVSRKVFPRTDFGSFGWIAKVPESLIDPLTTDRMIPSLDQLSSSFRSEEPKPRLTLWNQTWTRLDWIAKVPESLAEVTDFFAPWESQYKSFRVPERTRRLDLLRQTWQRLDWIAKVPENLVELTGIVIPSQDQWLSFRAPERSGQLDMLRQTWQRLDWIDKIAGSLPEPPPTPTTEFTISRNRFKLNLQGQHIGLKFQHDTLDEGVQLEDVGIGIGLFPRAWQNQHNMNLNGNHITLKFVHNVLDEIVYLQDVGFNIFTHGWR